MGRKLHFILGSFYRVDDRTGFPTRAENTKREWNNLIVNEARWEPRQPQDLVRGVKDIQAVPEPRPLGPNVFVGPFCTTFCPSVGVGETVLTVPSIDGFVEGDLLSVMMDNGVIFQVGLRSIGDGTLKLAAGLPYPASCGNQVCDLKVSANLPPPPPLGTIAFADGTPTTPVTQGSSGYGFIGTVDPSEDAPQCQGLLSTQNTVLPTTGWITAAFAVDPLFEVILPVPDIGTFYAWTQDPLTGVFAVSGPIEVVAAVNSISISSPLTADGRVSILQAPLGMEYNVLSVSGTISPGTDIAQYAINQSSTVAPTTGWTNAEGSSFWFTPEIPASNFPVGINYIWARDSNTGLTVTVPTLIASYNLVRTDTYETISNSISYALTDVLCTPTVGQLRADVAPNQFQSSTQSVITIAVLGSSNTVQPSFGGIVPEGNQLFNDGATINSDGTLPSTLSTNGKTSTNLLKTFVGEPGRPGPVITAGNYFTWFLGYYVFAPGPAPLAQVSSGAVTVVGPELIATGGGFNTAASFPPTSAPFLPSGPQYSPGASIEVSIFQSPAGQGAPSFALGTDTATVPASFSPCTLTTPGGATDLFTAEFTAPATTGTYFLWFKNINNGYGIYGSPIRSVHSQVLGTGDGSTTSFSGTLSSVPIAPLSVTVIWTLSFGGGPVFEFIEDNGSGVLSGSGLSSGSVNYATGAINLSFSSAPMAATSITATWTQ